MSRGNGETDMTMRLSYLSDEDVKKRMFELVHKRKRLLSSLGMFNYLIREAYAFIDSDFKDPIPREGAEVHLDEAQNRSDPELELHRNVYTEFMKEFEDEKGYLDDVHGKLQDVARKQGEDVGLHDFERRGIKRETLIADLDKAIAKCNGRLLELVEKESDIYKYVKTVRNPCVKRGKGVWRGLDEF